MHIIPALTALYLVGLSGPNSDSILQPGSKVTKVAGDCKFTEGPAVGPDGHLYFSDGRNDRIMKLTSKGKLTVFRQPCGRTNGMMFDAEGRLVMCQSSGKGGKRRVARIEKDGRETVLADKYGGKPFIAPNDLCIDKKGRIYFTDPYYGPPAEKSQPSSGVYRIDAPGKVVRLLTNLQKPNGILITPDNKTLYVSDRGTQKLHRYKVDAKGNLTSDGIVYKFAPDRGIDGMCLDEKGNIYAAAGQGKTTGLFVLSPRGKLLLHKPMPEFSTNVTFGGKDMQDLYLTATTSVYHMRTVHRGVRTPAFVPEKMALYLLIGQSNMAGRGKVSKLDRTPHPHVFTLTKEGGWVLAVDPLHFDKPIAGVGPGLTFGKTLAKTNPSMPIGLIPCACGGSPITKWQKGAYWKQTRSKPYDDMLRRAAIARKRGVLKGILWHQGESDSNSRDAELYVKRLIDLVTRLRRDLNAPDVPFLVGGMSEPLVARNKHARFVDLALRKASTVLTRTGYVPTKGLKLKADNIHFDAASARELGRRYAKELRRFD